MDRLDSTQFFYATTMSQSLASDEYMHAYIRDVTEQVIRAVLEGKKRYVVQGFMHRPNRGTMTPEGLAQFLAMLRERFPECIVEHCRAGIVIDWSH